jgi:four helix bundle protein
MRSRSGDKGDTPQTRKTKSETNPKNEKRNPKQSGLHHEWKWLLKLKGAVKMGDESTKKVYDLEERTYLFAKRVRAFVKLLPRTISNQEDVKQLIRSSGSVGANYIEANEALGQKDFLMHLKISRKEAKESRYWLRLVDTGTNSQGENERGCLIQESTELMNIFGSILRKYE